MVLPLSLRLPSGERPFADSPDTVGESEVMIRDVEPEE